MGRYYASEHIIQLEIGTHLEMLRPEKKSAMSCSVACQGNPLALTTLCSASCALASLSRVVQVMKGESMRCRLVFSLFGLVPTPAGVVAGSLLFSCRATTMESWATVAINIP